MPCVLCRASKAARRRPPSPRLPAVTAISAPPGPLALIAPPRSPVSGLSSRLLNLGFSVTPSGKNVSKNTQHRHGASWGGGLLPTPSARAASPCALRPTWAPSHQTSSCTAVAVSTPALGLGSLRAAAVRMQLVVSQPVHLVLGFLRHQSATPKDHSNRLYTPLQPHSPSLPPA